MIKFFCFNGSVLPTRGTKYSVALDIRCNQSVRLPHGELIKIPLGLISSMTNPIHDNFEAYCEMREKSGLAMKGISLHGGIIDSDYRDEWAVILRYDRPNHYATADYHFNQGDKVAQLIIHPYPWDQVVGVMSVDELDVISDNERKGGFGSTGV